MALKTLLAEESWGYPQSLPGTLARRASCFQTDPLEHEELDM